MLMVMNDERVFYLFNFFVVLAGGTIKLTIQHLSQPESYFVTNCHE